jgi:hypothetical protein
MKKLIFITLILATGHNLRGMRMQSKPSVSAIPETRVLYTQLFHHTKINGVAIRKMQLMRPDLKEAILAVRCAINDEHINDYIRYCDKLRELRHSIAESAAQEKITKDHMATIIRQACMEQAITLKYDLGSRLLNAECVEVYDTLAHIIPPMNDLLKAQFEMPVAKQIYTIAEKITYDVAEQLLADKKIVSKSHISNLNRQ